MVFARYFTDVIFCLMLKLSNFISLSTCHQNVSCYENETWSINEDFMKQINEFRALHSVGPLVLDRELVFGAQERARYLAYQRTSFVRDLNQTTAYDESVHGYLWYGPYKGSNIPLVKDWYERSLENVTNDPLRLLHRNGKAFGCGLCTVHNRDTYIVCRATYPNATTSAETNGFRQGKGLWSTLRTTLIEDEIASIPEQRYATRKGQVVTHDGRYTLSSIDPIRAPSATTKTGVHLTTSGKENLFNQDEKTTATPDYTCTEEPYFEKPTTIVIQILFIVIAAFVTSLYLIRLCVSLMRKC